MTLPGSVIALFLLLALGLLLGGRFAVQLSVEGRVKQPPGGQGLSRGADHRRRRRGRLVVRELMRNPGLHMRPVGFSTTTRGSSASRTSTD